MSEKIMPNGSVFDGGKQSQSGAKSSPFENQALQAPRHNADPLRSPAGFEPRSSGAARRGAKKKSLLKAPSPRGATHLDGASGSPSGANAPPGAAGTREASRSHGTSHIGDFVPRGVRRRVPEVAMGLLLVTLGAVLMVVFTGRSDPTRDVLALARNVSKGQFLTAEDVTHVALPADVPIAALDSQSQASILGSQLANDLPAGTVLTPQLLMPERDLPAGMVVIGSQLDAGQYPVRNFRVGERVNLLARSPSGEIVAVAEGVQIYEVSQLGSGNSLFVSFLIDQALQLEVASVLGDDSLRLGLSEVDL